MLILLENNDGNDKQFKSITLCSSEAVAETEHKNSIYNYGVLIWYVEGKRKVKALKSV